MSQADKLRERMRQSKSGWGNEDLHKLYTGFGFTCRRGAKHDLYAHPIHKHLRATVSRSRDLPTGYIETALQLLDELERNALEG